MTRIACLLATTDAEPDPSVQRALLQVALAHSPRVEDGGGGRVYLDASGLHGLFGDEPRLAARLCNMGVSRMSDLTAFRHGSWVKVAGAVVVRQRPGTAKGFVFLNLEDETGLINVIVRPPLFHRHRLTLVDESFLLIDGTLQRQDNVTSVRAERIWPLRHRLESVPSHDFH